MRKGEQPVVFMKNEEIHRSKEIKVGKKGIKDGSMSILGR